jgi:3-phosphoshikimate 1-carboxyvinyltransferase
MIFGSIALSLRHMTQIEPNLKIDLPTSKSIANRWLILDYLFKNTFNIEHFGDATDTLELQLALKKIQANYHEIQVINAGSGGTSLRFLMALLSKENGIFFLCGNQQLMSRPHQQLIKALQSLGADIQEKELNQNNGFLIHGKKWTKNEVRFEESISSQYVSAIALAAANLEQAFSIYLPKNLPSLPYLEITLACMRQAGIQVSYENNCVRIFPLAEISAQTIQIEKDWSAAAFFYALLAGKKELRLTFRGLNFQSLQADKKIASFGLALGIVSKTNKEGVFIYFEKEAKFPQAITFDFLDCPDLFPAVLSACIIAGVKLKATGIQHLIHKESNRILAMRKIAAQFGYDLQGNDDQVEMHLMKNYLKAGKVILIETCQDHRIAMCGAILKICFEDLEVKIDDMNCMAKSFPNFLAEINKISS